VFSYLFFLSFFSIVGLERSSYSFSYSEDIWTYSYSYARIWMRSGPCLGFVASSLRTSLRLGFFKSFISVKALFESLIVEDLLRLSVYFISVLTALPLLDITSAGCLVIPGVLAPELGLRASEGRVGGFCWVFRLAKRCYWPTTFFSAGALVTELYEEIGWLIKLS